MTTVNSPSGIFSVTDQPLILNAPATGDPPTSNTMDLHAHLQSMNLGSGLAPQQTNPTRQRQSSSRAQRTRQRQSSSRAQRTRQRQSSWRAQRSRDTVSKPDEVVPCIIRRCDKTYTRTHTLGGHLRDIHDMPIPKGQWVNKWLGKRENLHHIEKANNHQELMINMYSSAAMEQE